MKSCSSVGWGICFCFPNHLDSSIHPRFKSMGKGIGGVSSVQGVVQLMTQLRSAPRLRMYGALPSLPMYLHGMYKDNAALTLQTDNCLKLNQHQQTKHWDVLEVVQFLSLVFKEYHEFKFLTSFYLLELKKDINTELQRYKTINGIIKRNLGMQMSMIKFTPLYG
jgi:hypothetical protein